MSDNVDVTPGSGKTIATDDIGGIQYQLIKLAFGVDGAATLVSSSNELPVTMSSLVLPTGASTLSEQLNQSTYLSTIAGDTTSIQTAVELLDNSVDGNYLNVNLNIAGTDVSANSGTLTAQTLRVTIATDDEVNNFLSTIAGAVSGAEVQVDVLTMPTVAVTGTFYQATQPISGTVTANLSATDNAVLDAIAASLAGTLTVTGGGGGVEYTEGDTDATIVGSVVMMEVAANTIQPIQGTVADGLLVNLGTNNDVTVTSGTITTITNAVAVTNAGITTIAGAISGTEMQVDVLSMPSTTVTATNLDIRDLTHVSDSVKIGDGTDIADVIDSGTYAGIGAYILDGSGNPITSFGGGTQYSDADINADPTGTVAMGTDGSNIFAVHTDTSGDLQIDVLTMPTVAVTGTFWQATQPVSGTFYQATQPVSGTFYQATQPVSFTGSGDVATQTTLASLLTSSQLIDDVVYAEDSGHTTGEKGVFILGVRNDTSICMQ